MKKMIQPKDLINTESKVIKIKNAHYDWERQEMCINGMKAGTFQSTNQGTASRPPHMGYMTQDDSTMDNYTD